MCYSQRSGSHTWELPPSTTCPGLRKAALPPGTDGPAYFVIGNENVFEMDLMPEGA
jgi:hypothetical protein